MRLIRTFLILIIALITLVPSYASEGLFNPVEKSYIEEHSNETFTIGIYPKSGKDYFTYEGKIYGYILEVIDILEDETQMDFDLRIYSSWNSVYRNFLKGEVDLLFGVNKTEERAKEMLFTEPLDSIPYAIFIHNESDLLTIGDFENRIIGFQKSDMIINTFKEAYSNLTYQENILPTQYNGFHQLSNQRIDGFITPGGIMAFQFLYDYESIKLMTQLEGITTDMRLGTLKKDKTFLNIVKKALEKETSKERIEKAKERATLVLNQKVLQLTAAEKAYLASHDTIRVGITKNYKPLELLKDGEFLGVGGEIFNYIMQLVNIEVKVVADDFNALYSKAIAGEIDIMILAKTKEREKYFDFPRPFYNERDIIYGRKEMKSINSIYELENKRVAVVDGYWHEAYLKKNLIHSKIVITKNIQESLELLDEGTVDYLIENRLVGDYYINLYGYQKLEKKGVSRRYSALYYGVTKGNGPMVSIIDKALRIVDYNEFEDKGIQSIPYSEPIQVKKQRALIFILMVVLIGLIYLLYRGFNKMVDQKSESKILKEKQKLIYQDSLTGLKNRRYFDSRLRKLKTKENLCFIIIDLNDLKLINDTHGHLIGDELIKTAAVKIEEIFQDFEHIRFGGDEFLLISENKTEEDLEKLIEKSKEAANAVQIIFENVNISGFSFGIGYAIRNSLDDPVTDVFKRADESMYQNKILGKK